MAYRLAVKRRGRRPATPYKWEIYEDDKLVEQSLEYFTSKGKAVESDTKVLLRLRIRKAQELDQILRAGPQYINQRRRAIIFRSGGVVRLRVDPAHQTTPSCGGKGRGRWRRAR